MESETSQSANLVKFLAWVEVQKKRLLIWGGGGAAVILVIVLFYFVQKGREARASQALSELKAPLSMTEAPSQELADAYLKVARDYSGTEAAGRALLLNASALFNQNRFAEAQARFEEFLKSYGNSPWAAQGLFGVGSSLDAQGKAEEAIGKYEELRRRFPTHATVDEARLCLARLYEDGDRLEEALQIYEELAQTHADSALGAEAGMRREGLLKRNPELAQTNLVDLTALPPPTPLTTTSAPVTLTTNLPSAGTTNVTPLTIELPTPTPETPAPETAPDQ